MISDSTDPNDDGEDDDNDDDVVVVGRGRSSRGNGGDSKQKVLTANREFVLI